MAPRGDARFGVLSLAVSGPERPEQLPDPDPDRVRLPVKNRERTLMSLLTRNTGPQLKDAGHCSPARSPASWPQAAWYGLTSSTPKTLYLPAATVAATPARALATVEAEAGWSTWAPLLPPASSKTGSDG